MDNEELKEKNLAYGGQALIEGVMMRGMNSYAFTIKQNDGYFYKEKKDYIPLGKRIKILGLPFIRGIVGLFENMILGMKILNKSAEIAYPDEESKPTSSVTIFFAILFALAFSMVIFVGIPRFFPIAFKLDPSKNPIIYNTISAISRFILFAGYLIIISFMKDAKRLFAYHGAEHKTIHTYENKEELTIENVKKNSRLHPRCGTSFVFIVFLITLVVFPFFDIIFKNIEWYKNLALIEVIGLKLGKIIQNLIILVLHIFIGMPIVASISYEILKLSGKFSKNFMVKIFIAPGLFFQMFTTREPDDDMIKAAILSLKMILGEEKSDIKRKISDKITNKLNFTTSILFLLLYYFN